MGQADANRTTLVSRRKLLTAAALAAPALIIPKAQAQYVPRSSPTVIDLAAPQLPIPFPPTLNFNDPWQCIYGGCSTSTKQFEFSRGYPLAAPTYVDPWDNQKPGVHCLAVWQPWWPNAMIRLFFSNWGAAFGDFETVYFAYMRGWPGCESGFASPYDTWFADPTFTQRIDLTDIWNGLVAAGRDRQIGFHVYNPDDGTNFTPEGIPKTPHLYRLTLLVNQQL